jgi:hypothetical protein
VYFSLDHVNDFFIYLTDDANMSDGDGEDSDKEPAPKRVPTDSIPRHKEFGWPLIPRQGNRSLHQSKSVIRLYVTLIYRTPLYLYPFP